MNSLFRKIKNYVIFSPTAQENDFKLKNKSNDIEYDVRDEKTETTLQMILYQKAMKKTFHMYETDLTYLLITI